MTPALSPARSPATRAPVFLLHGIDDNVIPSTESLALQEYLTAARQPARPGAADAARQHADARADAPLGDIWRLIRFWTRMWDGLER